MLQVKLTSHGDREWPNVTHWCKKVRHRRRHIVSHHRGNTLFKSIFKIGNSVIFDIRTTLSRADFSYLTVDWDMVNTVYWPGPLARRSARPSRNMIARSYSCTIYQQTTTQWVSRSINSNRPPTVIDRTTTTIINRGYKHMRSSYTLPETDQY